MFYTVKLLGSLFNGQRVLQRALLHPYALFNHLGEEVLMFPNN